MVMQVDNSAEEVLAELDDAPAASVGDFGNQVPHMDSFEQSTHLGRQRSTGFGASGLGKESAADVAVVESTQQMVALEHRLKQPHIVRGNRVEAGIASLTDHFPGQSPTVLG